MAKRRIVIERVDYDLPTTTVYKGKPYVKRDGLWYLVKADGAEELVQAKEKKSPVRLFSGGLPSLGKGV